MITSSRNYLPNSNARHSWEGLGSFQAPARRGRKEEPVDYADLERTYSSHDHYTREEGFNPIFNKFALDKNGNVIIPKKKRTKLQA